MLSVVCCAALAVVLFCCEEGLRLLHFVLFHAVFWWFSRQKERNNKTANPNKRWRWLNSKGRKGKGWRPRG